MLELNPPSSLDSIHPELATILLREDGTLAMDTTPESVRNYLGMAVYAEVETTARVVRRRSGRVADTAGDGSARLRSRHRTLLNGLGVAA